MSYYLPKPYKQLDRATGTWRTVQPEPVDLSKSGRQYSRTIINNRVKSNYKLVLQVFEETASPMTVTEVMAKIPGGINFNSLKNILFKIKRSGLVVKTKETIRNANNQPCYKYQLKQSIPA